MVPALSLRNVSFSVDVDPAAGFSVLNRSHCTSFSHTGLIPCFKSPSASSSSFRKPPLQMLWKPHCWQRSLALHPLGSMQHILPASKDPVHITCLACTIHNGIVVACSITDVATDTPRQPEIERPADRQTNETDRSAQKLPSFIMKSLDSSKDLTQRAHDHKSARSRSRGCIGPS